VLEFQLSQLRLGLPGLKLHRAAKRFTPLFQLILEEAFLAAPNMQCEPL
jgi:hypothetical protein